MRHPLWPSQLAAYIEGARNRPFAFGTHDCLLFAAGAVQAITGQDPAAAIRGTYSDERSALKVIHTHGGMHGLAVACFGEPMANPRHMQRGDVALVRTGGRDSLAVCDGPHLWAPGVARLEQLPMTEAKCAWRV